MFISSKSKKIYLLCLVSRLDPISEKKNCGENSEYLGDSRNSRNSENFTNFRNSENSKNFSYS